MGALCANICIIVMCLIHRCHWGRILGIKSLLPPIIISVESIPRSRSWSLLFLKLPGPWGPPRVRRQALASPSTSISICSSCGRRSCDDRSCDGRGPLFSLEAQAEVWTSSLSFSLRFDVGPHGLCLPKLP